MLEEVEVALRLHRGVVHRAAGMSTLWAGETTATREVDLGLRHRGSPRTPVGVDADLRPPMDMHGFVLLMEGGMPRWFIPWLMLLERMADEDLTRGTDTPAPATLTARGAGAGVAAIDTP